MSQKTIIILYNEKESKIDINLEEINSYSLLKQKILSFYNELNTPFTYHLMAINTSSPYTLLDEENFNQILNEKIEGEELKLFLNKIIPEDTNIDIIKENNENKIDIEDDDFIFESGEDDKNNNLNINKEEIKQEEKKEEIININNIDDDSKQLKINEIENKNEIKIEKNNIINEKNKIENDDKDLFSQTDEMMKKIDKLIGNDDSPFLKYSKNLDSKKEEINIKNSDDNKANGINNINNIENKNIAPFPLSHKNQNLNINIINNINNEDEKDNNENENLDEDILISKYTDPDTFKTIKCTICKSQLSDIKYICCICENLILCEKCEKNHFHPCFKLKTNFLSTTGDIYRFISTFYSFKSSQKNFFSKLFSKEYELKINPLSDKKIFLRPNKNFLLPIKISNFSNNPVNSTQIEIIPKNNKIIKIINENRPFTIKQNSNYTYKFKCRTKKQLIKEKVEFYLFSESLRLKDQEGLNFTIEFEINEDWDEEEININLEYNEYGILYSKEHKKIALEILKTKGKQLWNKEFIKNVFSTVVKCNWDKNAAINKLKM